MQVGVDEGDFLKIIILGNSTFCMHGKGNPEAGSSFAFMTMSVMIKVTTEYE